MSNPVLELAQGLIAGLKPGADDNWTGFCPIHGELPGKSTPSFSINVQTGLWYCFAGCGGGHLRRLLHETGRSRKAIDVTMARLDPLLAKKAKKPGQVIKAGMFQTRYPLPERILGLFETCPEDLLESGFTEDILWSHDVGVDTERGCITYPIRDINGALAGIMGRTSNPGASRYKLYRQELRDMGFANYDIKNHDYLWRWDVVYPQTFAVGERPTVYVCEGFKAAMWMVQCGYENTVATMGSFLSDPQRIFLERLGGTLVWCADFDRAGQKMVAKGSKKVQGLRQVVLNYPDGFGKLQPDDLSPEELELAITSSLNIARWRRRYPDVEGNRDDRTSAGSSQFGRE